MRRRLTSPMISPMAAGVDARVVGVVKAPIDKRLVTFGQLATANHAMTKRGVVCRTGVFFAGWSLSAMSGRP